MCQNCRVREILNAIRQELLSVQFIQRWSTNLGHCKLKLTINTNQVKWRFLKRGQIGVTERREPTNLTHICRQIWESNQGHIDGRRVLSPLRHPCTPCVVLLCPYHLTQLSYLEQSNQFQLWKAKTDSSMQLLLWNALAQLSVLLLSRAGLYR